MGSEASTYLDSDFSILVAQIAENYRELRDQLLIHASFNLNRVCKTSTPMPLLLTYLMPEAASSFYTLLHVGKDANVISIDLTLVRRK